MINPEKINRPIQTIVAYSADPWESVLPILRYTGPASLAGLEVIRGNHGDAIDIQKVNLADLVIIQRDFPRFTRACADIVLSARKQGKPIVYETDDLLIDLPEHHISYSDLSMYITPMLFMVFEADLVTTSTPYLYEYILPLQPGARLLPNFLHDKLWSLQPAPVPSPDRKIVIGYMGGDTHFHDICSITSPLLRLLERFPDQIELRFWGCKPPPELYQHTGVDWTPLSILDYADFAAYFNRQRIDIAVAPLEDTALNLAKSHLKFLEYSAIGAAGVYSRLQPYEKIVVHGENGYLASSPDEWEAALTLLIQDPKRRHSTAQAAQTTVSKDWLLSEHASLWAETYADASTSSPHSIERTKRSFYIVNKAQDRVLDLEAQRSRLEHQRQLNLQQINIIQDALTSSSAALRETKVQVQSLQNEKQDLSLQLANIQHSRGWKFLTRLHRLRQFLAPSGSRREKFLRWSGILPPDQS